MNKALEFGCAGYLLKESSIEELKQAIRSVANGYKHIGNSVFHQLKQFSLAVQPSEKVQESNFNQSAESYHTGLATISGSELNFESLNFQQQEIAGANKLESLKQNEPAKPSQIYLTEDAKSHRRSWLHNIGSSLLLVGLGCAVGITSFIYISDRAAQSFAPITKYGTVRGNTISIKTPTPGVIKQITHQIGDLVEADAIIGKLEPQYSQEQNQDISNILQQIEETQQHLENQKKLLAVTQSNSDSEQQKLRQLLSTNSLLKPANVNQADKAAFSSHLLEAEAKKEFQLALINYQQLKKLQQQEAVSDAELESAEQAWIIAQSKLKVIQNMQQAQSLDFSQQEAELREKKQQNIAIIQSNIEKWNAQGEKLENTIKLLEKNLNQAKAYLAEIRDSYQNQQLIDLKAPFTGVIQQINQITDEPLNEDQTFVELLNCNDLWIEVILDNNSLAEIDLRRAVMLEFDVIQPNFFGSISSLQPVDRASQYYLETNSAPALNFANNSTGDNLDAVLLYQINIEFSVPHEYVPQDEYCGMIDTALVTFNYE
ncbi:MAG: HlyD family efflux transporter periplasmic adaptor subunit [Cyanobacteria bacterium J06558_2]